MKSSIFLLLAILISSSAPVLAGPNADGAIIVHTNDAYSYVSTTVCTSTLGQPASCEAAITRTDKGTAAVVWFLAAFPPGAYPTVASVYFGINYDDVNLDPTTRFGFCGPAGSAEAPDAGWPANAAGNSVGFGTPVVGDTLFRFYYFKVDEFSGVAGPFLCSAINPTGGYAKYYDDSFPPREDVITHFGCVKWYQTGSNSCPPAMPVGVCCSASGVCLLTTESSCVAPGVWHSEWLSCSPNPCPASVAACCHPDGSCTVAFEVDCLAPAVWHVEWANCSPNHCPQPIGVCCDPAGACTITTHAGCAAPKIWHVEWTTCSPNPCPPVGACCASNSACALITQALCLPPSVWHSEWTTCSPNPCPQPLRACCTPTESCTLRLEVNCLPPDLWHPEWTSCTPNPCVGDGGPNRNGAIIVHTNDAYSYLSTTVCTTSLGQPAQCEMAITRTDKSVGAVVWFLASFLPTMTPSVAGVYFGVHFDEASLDPSVGFGPCGPGTVEAPDAGWPSNLVGNSVGFGTPVVGNTLFRFYYFKVDELLGSPGPQLCSAINPTGGYAAFWDTSFPPLEDRISQFGCVAWYAFGHNECPVVTGAGGACCLPTGTCTLLTLGECAAAGGIYQGDDVPCAPVNPCAAFGACCAPDGICAMTLAVDCVPPNVWHVEFQSCSPNQCPMPAPGPNANGAIIVHTRDSYTYLSTTVCTTTLGQPGLCEEAVTRTDKSAGAVVWLLAAFLQSASPRVSTVYFGLHFDWANLDPSLKFGFCGPTGSVEAPDAGWPSETAGNSVGFGTPVVGNTLFRFYYFKIDDRSGGPPAHPYFCSAANPTGGYAAFFDDAYPPAQDVITRFGCVRWYEAGSNDCQTGLPIIGACCFLDGHCELLTQVSCQAAPGYGDWYGSGTTCVPVNPCPSTLGACCSPDGDCTFVIEANCAPPNVWHPGWICVPNYCPPPVRTEKTTWGKIKASFR